jgi:uncharacterized protein (TIGR03086 family)
MSTPNSGSLPDVIDTEPTAFHRAVAGHFTTLTAGVTDWAAPAPVEGWTARDVVRHLVEWFPSFLEGGTGIALPAGPSVDADPAAAWRVQADAVQALLDDPATADRVLTNPHVGDVPLPEAIARFYVNDVFMHAWDLARASGQDDTLDPDRCTRMLAEMEPMDAMLRASGQYGPRQEAPPGAAPHDRLMAFVGRVV